jgi:hypothetical protein
MAMRQVTVDRGGGQLLISVPDDAAVLEYAERPVPGAGAVLAEAALDAPLGLPRLEDLAGYRQGGAYHPYHPFWLFNENEYSMRTAGHIIMAGAKSGEFFEAMGVRVVPTFEAAWEEARRLVGDRPRVAVLPTFWSKPRIKFRVAA